MDDAFPVSMAEGLGTLDQDLSGFVGMELPLATDMLVQVHPFDEFQGEECAPLMFASLEDLDNVRMLQPRHRRSLSAEARQGGRMPVHQLSRRALVTLDEEGNELSVRREGRGGSSYLLVRRTAAGLLSGC